MEDIFITEFLNLDNEFKELGVFDSIINRDSPFFINLLRLKVNKTPEFQDSYERINSFYRRIMILFHSSENKGDKLYRTALGFFHFPGVRGINLGLSETGIDAGFGPVLSKQVINDAFDIVKSGSEQPEIFQLVGLFEKNVSADRLSDMIATIILPDIRNYTVEINRKLNINAEKYPQIKFQGGIAINPYKKCELLYLPEEVLHEIPIAESWSDIDRVIQENQAIRDEVNEGPGPVDLKMSRGNDKTVVEIKLSSNADYIHGYEEQIEEYVKAEGTTQRVFVYVKVGNPVRDDKIENLHKSRLEKGENPPELFIIDSRKQTSASKR